MSAFKQFAQAAILIGAAINDLNTPRSAVIVVEAKSRNLRGGVEQVEAMSDLVIAKIQDLENQRKLSWQLANSFRSAARSIRHSIPPFEITEEEVTRALDALQAIEMRLPH